MLGLLIEDVTLVKQRQITASRPLPGRSHHYPHPTTPAHGAHRGRSNLLPERPVAAAIASGYPRFLSISFTRGAPARYFRKLDGDLTPVQ